MYDHEIYMENDTVFGNKADTLSLIQCDERGKLFVKSE